MDSTTPSRSAPRWLPAVIGFIAMTGIGALIGYSLVQARGGDTLLDLKPASDFTVPLYSGGQGTFTLSSHLGQPVVLNFWGSWCPPCRAEFPALQAVFDEYRDDGLVVFGVDVQDSEADAKAFLAEQSTTFPTGPDLDNSITIDYRVSSWPTTFFITRDGEIHRKWVGQLDETRLATFVEELFAL
ncbi:MAG: TlpA family protein disulfide reductase [Chloroflexi bacterium]|nr:TlpA family protein disulfide reductase [Chloroflexota bacterium]